MNHHNVLKEKMSESLFSVLPITLTVILLCLFWVPLQSGIMLSFLFGSVLIVVGMGLFTLGSEISMTQIGNQIGAKMTKSRKLWLILLLSFVLGAAITLAEPDLQVLANNAPNIDKTVLLVTVSVGVGLFLMLSMIRILFRIELKWFLIVFYTIIFLISAFSNKDFLSVAFDSGGVTTGPITVPFIMALGVGAASIRSDSRAKSDSFGLVALCSVGPILAVLILGFIYQNGGNVSSEFLISKFENTRELGTEYFKAFPVYFKEVAAALFPIFAFFGIFQIFSLKLHKRMLAKIIFGIFLTYIGLVLFLTGVNVGFSPLGYVLGKEIASKELLWLLVPIAMIMGWFIINAEPAVSVLTKQVSEQSAGAISEKIMRRTLSIAISAAMGLAIIRVITGISILWFMIPGYLTAIALSFFVPSTFTAIAFDAGGVASGPLTATFMLPFAMGACTALQGNVMSDAFGIVAMVAMTPLITVQIMGALFLTKHHTDAEEESVQFDNDDVIELWEVS